MGRFSFSVLFTGRGGSKSTGFLQTSSLMGWEREDRDASSSLVDPPKARTGLDSSQSKVSSGKQAFVCRKRVIRVVNSLGRVIKIGGREPIIKGGKEK